MEDAQNNTQILAFINAQMKSDSNNQMNTEEQAKMIETLKKFQEFINIQKESNEKKDIISIKYWTCTSCNFSFNPLNNKNCLKCNKIKSI